MADHNNTHGGARPGAGRPRVRWHAGQPGTVWIMERSERPGGLPDTPRRWRFLSIDDDGTLEFQDADSETIITIRPTDA